MPQDPKEPTSPKQEGKPIKISIAPDPGKAFFNNTPMDFASTHLFELPVGVSIKKVKIEKDKATGEVKIHLTE